MIKLKEKITTIVLKVIELDRYNKLFVEKIEHEGHRWDNCFMVRSYALTAGDLFFYVSQLAGENAEIDLDNDGKIKNMEFRVFHNFQDALAFAEKIKENIYPQWLKNQ